MYGIQTPTSLPLTRPQAPETQAAAPQSDAPDAAAGQARAAPQEAAAPALAAARAKADQLGEATREVGDSAERQTAYETRLAEQRSAAAFSGGEAPQARREAPSAALDEARNAQTVSARLFESNLKGVAQSGHPMSAEQKQALQSGLEDTFADAPPQARSAGAPMLYAAGQGMADSDLWDMISDQIGKIKDNYLGVYENVVGQYTDFYKAFSDILSKMANWIKPGSDGNKVKLNVDALKAALADLKTKFSLPNKAAVLFPAQGKDGAVQGGSESDARKWAGEMGLPDSCVKQSADGNWVVVVDMTPIDTMIRDVGALGSGTELELDNAKFQAWQSGFKAQEENLKNTLQTLTQKYSNANSLFDNLVKVLSSTISSCLETAKSFLQI
ncbi:type III secretion system needle tip protein SctA [Chromobacterium violaceum]|uniref:type III secretion system needle tip protein SctA n=1 Tax=Chromobacterium violaceum TaxID=536 RepID=UPI001E2BC199|nr:type III secretion system needle tip protein SctA [Chromobacterium violaceum]MCD0494638.1 type III secretion system needle tip protein SctA [Chromobacterium violaceum]